MLGFGELAGSAGRRGDGMEGVNQILLVETNWFLELEAALGQLKLRVKSVRYHLYHGSFPVGDSLRFEVRDK